MDLLQFTHATFLVDPPTFVVVGMVVAGLFRWRRSDRTAATGGTIAMRRRYLFAQIAMFVFMVAFIGFAEAPCYFDLTSPPGFSGAATCNEFMWHGYVKWPFSWLTGEPPIPSYGRQWSTMWLIGNWLFQMGCGHLTVALCFRRALRDDAASRPAA